MQYFLPNVPFVDEAALVKHGLGYAFEVEFLQCTGTGPDGQSGSFVGRTERIGQREHYQWEQLPEGGAWFGWRNGFTPEDFARPEQIQGELVRMANGQQWLVPMACDYIASVNGPAVTRCLPRMWKRNCTRWIPGEVMPKYRELWEAAIGIAGKWFGNRAATADDGEASGELGVTTGELFDLVALSLRANYYVSHVECGVLGLIADTPELLQGVIHAVFGMGKFEQLLKKTG